MADDHSQRSYRSNDALARREQPKAQSASSGTDPLAELARLIGQSDPFGEYGRETAVRQPPPAAEWPQETQGDWAQQVPPHAPAQVRVSRTVVPPAPQIQAQPYAVPDFIRRPPAAAPNPPGYDVHQDNYGQVPEGDGYDTEHAPYAAEDQDFYDDVPPSRRRMGIMVVAGIFALAVIGTAGAFGYRAVFGSSGAAVPPPVIKADTAPSKIVPVASKDTASTKLITDRVNTPGQGEKVVSREEQPVEVKDKPAGVIFPPPPQADQAGAPPVPMGNGIISTDAKKVRTISIRPDQATIADASPNGVIPDAPPPQAAPPAPPPPHQAARPTPQRQAAAPDNAPLSLNPNAAPAPHLARTANAAPTELSPAATGSTHGYAVQVTSQRSEADAQSAYRSLQHKYASALGGKPMFVHKVDLGAKGVYYRAMVGPYTSQAEAGQICSSLKSAGGQCFVQRN